MSKRTREERRYRRVRIAFWIVVVIWAILCVYVLCAKADGYMGDANAEFEAALAARQAARHRIDDCKITYYCCEQYKHICNAGPPFITASGRKPRAGVTCAADDIPLGATVMVDWDDDGVIDEWLICEDRFGGKQKNHIDICVATHKEALAGGRKKATVYWSKEGA